MALVSGSSRGLGRSIARRLARDGMAVAVNGLHDDQVVGAAEAIAAEGGVARAFPADVTDERAVAELVDAANRNGGTDNVTTLLLQCLAA